MKRVELLKTIANWAKANGYAFTTKEGGRHTKITVGDKRTVIPRHSEIAENTAKNILKQLGIN